MAKTGVKRETYFWLIWYIGCSMTEQMNGSNLGGECLSLEIPAKKYLGLLNDLSEGLPLHEYWKGLKGQKKVVVPAIDSFVEKYAPEYGDKAREMENVAVILDAAYVMWQTDGVINSGMFSAQEIETVHKERYQDAKESLESRLKMVYSDRGKATGEDFDTLYKSFFSEERMSKIREAMDIRVQSFDGNGALKNQTLSIVSGKFGLLKP